ncbi:MAG: UDP-N-acetylglucosamine 1-carboxyvinyltransferase [Candidatus Brennerbacteria bacterium]|nr:UDP-N-acetylglucosamine 1-carboxyvinyltransferase [Candidatus Brennerbacteria bacterium]
MSSFVIKGGGRLEGEISVSGSKNAALPIIAASILSREPVYLDNLPLIGDVFTMLKILQSMGSEQEWLGKSRLMIKNKNLDPAKLDQHLVKKIRASVLLIGPLLARFGKAVLKNPGGCHIGARPLTTHIEAFKDIGAKVDFDEKENFYYFELPKVSGFSVSLKEQSVTATENLMIFFAFQDSPAEINIAAAEPHIWDLGRFLETLGVKIEGLGTSNIKIKGNSKLASRDYIYPIISDYIEAGTFLVLGAVAASRLLIKNFPVSHLESVLQKAADFGVDYEIKNNESLAVRFSKLKAANIKTQTYPGFPTDLQSPFSVLAAKAEGDSLIFDTLYEGRLKYIDELKKMGARARIIDSHQALISGQAELKGAEIQSLDLRSGAVMVIAALAAKGNSVLHNIEQIDRGYERLEERLQKLGAEIKRVN